MFHTRGKSKRPRYWQKERKMNLPQKKNALRVYSQELRQLTSWAFCCGLVIKAAQRLPPVVLQEEDFFNTAVLAAPIKLSGNSSTEFFMVEVQWIMYVAYWTRISGCRLNGKARDMGDGLFKKLDLVLADLSYMCRASQKMQTSHMKYSSWRIPGISSKPARKRWLWGPLDTYFVASYRLVQDINWCCVKTKECQVTRW